MKADHFSVMGDVVNLQPFLENINSLYFEIEALTANDRSQLRVGSEAHEKVLLQGVIVQQYYSFLFINI